ncbi:MAG: asparagine synthase (glutamine-hydrolyzing) [Anaerolineales bacterium]|nr:asparagine synthase (glutamine-hydrolyzing) [Anaerolineales bacterium]
MCGISGIFSVRPASRASALKILKSLNHRGPDGSGLFTALDDRLVLGHNRLSIVDLSEANAQPFHAHHADVVVVFNGEIYNFKTLRTDLETLGHSFHTTGDTEVIVEGYLEWGTNLFSRLAGMFALAIWDGRKQNLYLARDSFGIKPLYYFSDDQRLLFGSEIKAIFTDSSIERQFNLPIVIDLASFGFHLSNETVFTGIHQLPPGYLMEIRLDDGKLTCSTQPFLKFEDIIGENNTKEITPEFLYQQLSESVNAHLVSDAPLAMSLSGGLDSSAVCALASRINPEIMSYTIGYDDKSDETPFAKAVSQKLDIKQTVITAKIRDTGNLFRRIAWHLEEPVPNVQLITPFFLGQTLRSDGIKVVLLGEGADEVFGGYPWHALAKLHLGSSILFALYSSWRRTSAHNIQNLFEKSFYQRHVNQRMAYQYNEFMRIWREGRGTPLQRFLQFDCKYQLVYSQLLRVDKMLMAHSVEGRVPFLYAPLVSSSWNIPDHSRIWGPTIKPPIVLGKIILRQAMRDLLPQVVVDRIKFGRTGTQNLYQVGLRQLLSEATSRMENNAKFAKAREALPFINWNKSGMADQLSPKLQLFLLLLLYIADLGIEKGFERPNDFDARSVDLLT